MNFDHRVAPGDQGPGRDHRVRTASAQPAIPGAVGKPVVDGASATPRVRQPRTRDATDGGQRDARSGQQRRDTERELARLLRLLPEERLEIAVDPDCIAVRFRIVDRASGALLRELAPEAVEPLLHQLTAPSGTFVDRSL